MRAECAMRRDLCPCSLALSNCAQVSAGFCSGLCDALEAFGNLVIENMRIAQRVPDVGVIEHPLYQLEVVGLAQRLGRKIVAKVVEAETDNTSHLAQPVPVRP